MPETFLQQLLHLPEVTSAYLSTDGRYIAFNWNRRHPNRDVFVVPADGSSPPVALTNTPEATRFVSWAPGSQAVVVAEDHNGDERVRLFKVSLYAPEVMQPLTEDSPPCFLRGGSLSPDDRFLYYGANYDFANNEAQEATWIYRHDLLSGQRSVLARPERPDYSVPVPNRQGTHLLYSRRDHHPSGRQFHLIDLTTGEDREILNFGDRHKLFARWFPDGEHILVLSESTGNGPQQHASLGIYHWPSGTMQWIIDDPARYIKGAWTSPDGLVIVDEVHDGCHRPTWIDPASGQETAFPTLPGNLLPLGRSAAGEWAAIYYAADTPNDLLRFNDEASSADDLHSLTKLWQHTNLDRSRLTLPEDFRWQSPDDTQVQGWLYRAQPNRGRTIIRIHGGPTMHAENYLRPEIQYYLSRGFNVLAVNYRGSTGFGLTYQMKIKEDGWGGREQDDIASGAQALIDAGLATPSHVGVTGTSFGGYSAWCLITRYAPELITAAAPICGMTDLVTDYETTRPDLRPISADMMGGTPQEIPDKYHKRSPIHFVENIHGSLLIVQGSQDPNVTPENVHQVTARLGQADIPYDLLVFPDEGHGILKPNNQQQLFTRLADFFEKAFA
jgi:dipeptidyl aminopeptidase/acylaminoacyl peptidase